jgi:hypothetical protein
MDHAFVDFAAKRADSKRWTTVFTMRSPCHTIAAQTNALVRKYLRY